MRRRIRITESQLRHTVNEAVRGLLREREEKCTLSPQEIRQLLATGLKAVSKSRSEHYYTNTSKDKITVDEEMEISVIPNGYGEDETYSIFCVICYYGDCKYRELAAEAILDYDEYWDLFRKGDIDIIERVENEIMNGFAESNFVGDKFSD